ncbi:unnamed protein product [Cyprideis torosa]|uniref:K Homology domain-containing protein n=1 Tax=Cyprideis torosa TaxID=163714 RepID=A0A7R8WIT1_9CRUS|nr:unnamed protein product [Cyprideis torosa]CAG0894457.1 unnamed protein product [Cyprideis torosa]
MSEPEILRPPGFVVYPGAKLVEASSDSPSRLVLGPGVRSVGHQVVASSVGRFHAKDKRFFWIGKHQRRYVPAKGDVVIGLIGRKIASGERCLVNYDSDSNGNIHFMAFEATMWAIHSGLDRGHGWIFMVGCSSLLLIELSLLAGFQALVFASFSHDLRLASNFNSVEDIVRRFNRFHSSVTSQLSFVTVLVSGFVLIFYLQIMVTNFRKNNGSDLMNLIILLHLIPTFFCLIVLEYTAEDVLKAYDETIESILERQGDGRICGDAEFPQQTLLQSIEGGATKKNKPELNDLDVIYARVLSCQSSDKVEFTCVDHLGKASGMGRLGNSDGTVLFLDTETCRRLLTTEASILDRIGRDIPLECAIGMNGRIWLRCKDLTCETAVTQIILRLQEEWNNTEPEVIIRQEVESLLTAIPVTKLADRQQERLVERVGSLIESKMAAGRWREVRKIDPSYFYWSSNGREWERMAYRPNPDCRYLPPTTRGLREMPNDPGFFLSGQPNKKKRTSQKLARELMTLAHLAYKEQIPDDLDVVNVTLRKKIEGSVVMVLVKFPDQAVIKVYKPACNKDGRLLQPPFYVKIEGRMTKVSRSPLTNDLKLDWKEDGKNVSIRVEKDGSWSVEREEETGKPAEKKKLQVQANEMAVREE